MANKIKGLTIEVAGETTLLQKSMADVNKSTRDLKSELRDVERLLKLDPGNTELIAQKQKILADSIDGTKDKLNQLKEAEKQAQEQFKKGEISEEQYRALQREVIKTETELKKLESTSKDFGTNLTRDLKDAGKSMQDFGSKVEGAGKKFAPVSAVAGGALAGIVGLGIKAAKSADDINTLAKQTGLSTDQIQKFQYATELIDVPLETLTGSMSKLTKNMGTARDGTGAAAEAFDLLGVSVTNSDGTLRSNQDVFTEVIAKLGEVENATERDTIAMDLFGKSAQDLNPLILGGADALKTLGDEAEAAGLILSEDALNSANEFNDAMDTLKAKTAGQFAAVGAEVATMLIPVLETLGDTLSKVLEWVGSLDAGTLQMIMTVLAVVAGIAPLLIIIGKVITAVGVITSALPVLGAAFAVITGPIGLMIAAVAAVIAIGVLLYKNWDAIKAKAKELWDNLKNTFNSIKQAILAPITSAIDTLKNINLVDIGKNIIGGLINGISSMIGKVKETVGNIAGAVTGGVKSLLKIQSPSKVMEEMGEYTGEGFANGIENSLKGISKQTQAMRDVTTSAGSGTSASNSNTSNSFKNNFNISQLIVREEADLKKVARELYKIQVAGARG
jgi:phage-related minor tail protein